jgi:glycosyltransferase involved in cell wall biosynthesis
VDAARERGLPHEVFPCRGQVDPRAILEIRRRVRELEIDIVHSHETKSNVYSLLCTFGTKARKVATCHNWIGRGWKIRVYNRIDKMILRWLSKVVAVSDQVERQVLQAGVPRGRLERIDNGVQLARFEVAPETADEVRREWGIPSGHGVIGTIARLSREKNIELVLEACKRVRAERPAATLVIVGDGEHRGSLERQAERLGIEEHVRFLGVRRDIPRILSGFDLFVLTSEKEGMPMVILEAMAARRPVLSTPVGAIPQVVSDGQTGFLVRPGDAAQLAGRMLLLLGDPARARTMGERAHQAIRHRHSTEKMGADYVRLYEAALGA